VSYQVFARKYRPQTFDEVIGQEHITQTLKNAIGQNRLAHAYLFVGPRGTGKTSTARILAKALNCEKGPTISPCGKCDVCKEISQGNSLDVLEIDGASNNGVEQVRELRENVRFAPTRGKYRIYIIDEVHMLSAAAFNALLKTLEEPPAHVKFVFATTEPQKVMATILSRCQRFDLRRIPAALIAKHLQFIAKKEKFALDDDAAKAIAIGAEGGLRDAESMLDQLVAFCGDKIAEQDVLSIFGFTSQQTVSGLCGHILGGASAEALGVVHEQAEAGKDLSRLMTDLIAHLRNLIVMKADPASMKAELGEKALASLRSQADALPMERLLELIEQFADAEARMKWAPNKKLYFEIAVIKAVQTLGQTTLTEVIATLSALRGGKAPPAATPKPAARIESPPPAQTKKVEQPKPSTGDADLWPALLQRVRQERPLISAWIEAVKLLRIEGDACVIGFGKSHELSKESLTRPNNQKFLEGILAELAGRGIAIRWEKRDDVADDLPETEEEKSAPSGDPMTAFKNDPLIKKALEIFKGEIQSA
jgi:DNA polymerase-3 subunit gamma/tau